MTSDRPPRLTLVWFALAGLVMVVAAIGLSQIVDGPEPAERVIVIPLGTADRIAGGEDVDLVPADLRIRLRDYLVVINNDVANHQVGPLVVGPGEQLRTLFAEAATVQGFCSLHSTGQITIHVGGSDPGNAA